jgi:hypothetical protein
MLHGQQNVKFNKYVLYFVDGERRIIFVQWTNTMLYLSLYFVTTPLDVSGSFLDHHLEAKCTYNV